MFEILNWLKKKKDLPQAVSEEVDKEFEKNKPELPYDINNVSSPILIIAEKWKNNPKRVKVKHHIRIKTVFEVSDKKVKGFSVAIDSSRSTLYVNSLDSLQLNSDELQYLNYNCGDEITDYYTRVVNRYESIKGLEALKERKRIQKLFEEK